ncbi:amino acid adenylation domain-containing protein [Streptomyces sp. NPDC002328]|uniref:amino acid adenylation domain-containing protein n=1 Tax=Streptomyces sp. NPDC002328 TaxID=3364642 RepID=UPI0036AA20E9
MPTDDHGSLPLTSAQAGVWFAQRLDPLRRDYAIGEYLEIHGALDPELFQEALRRMLAETEALGMRFGESDGAVWQRPAAGLPPFRLETVDVSGAPDPVAAAEARMRAELARPMDPASGDVHRQLLVRTGPEVFCWMQGYHHIVADGVSGPLLARRVAEHYSALVAGGSVPPTDAVPWREIVAEEEAYLASGAREADRAFWQGVLADLPEPVGFAGRPGQQGQQGQPTQSGQSGQQGGGGSVAAMCDVVRVRGDVPDGDARMLREAARTYGTRWSALVIAAAAAYLHRVNGSEDVVLGLPVTGRATAAARRTPGMFSRVLPLRLAVTGTTTLGELVRRTSAGIKDVLRHQRYRIEEAHGGARLWDATVNLMSFDYGLAFGGAPSTVHNLTVGPVDHLTLNVYDRGGDSPLTVQVEAAAGEMDADEAHSHRERFTRFLAGLAAAGPDAVVDSLGLLTPDDERRLAVFADGGAADAPADRCLHELFEEQAARTPDAVAVVCDGEEVTYGALDAWADELACLLRPLTGPGRPVGVRVRRSPAMVAALLGVLKAGGCYVPLDPALPAARVAYVVDRAGIGAVVVDAADSGGGLLPERTAVVPVRRAREEGEVRDVRDLRDVRGAGAVVVPDGPDGPGGRGGAGRAVVPALSAAYLLYTSGSTGEPKGVVVPHAAAVDFVHAHLAVAEVGAGQGGGERFLGFAALSFDVSVLDVFGALLSGGTLVLATDEERTDLDRLQSLMARQKVTVADLPSALLPLLDPRALPALRFLSTGGEAPSADAVARWAAGGREVWNGYGPTEATVEVTMHRCAPGDGGRVPPIGRPMVNHRAYVVDSRLRLLPPGAAGELCVAGAGLAQGYAGRPGLTADRFVPDPFSDVPGARMYRTGDLVRWSADGDLEYLGRIDQQVKVNGYRVELGEIETVLGRHPSVRQAAVDVRPAPGGGRRLVAFVAPEPGGVVAPSAELAAHLAEFLPHYMVPHIFVALDALPLTANKKVDRRALPTPGPDQEPEPDTPAREPAAGPEGTLCALFADVLGRAVAPDDNFFSLGGDSIAALTLVSRARARGLTFTLGDVFTHKTPAALAGAVGSAMDSSLDAPDAMSEQGDSVEKFGESATTPVMRWLLDGPGPIGRFSQSMTLTLPAGADDARLVRVLQTVLDRHAALRLRVAEGPDGRPALVIGEPGSVDAAGVLRRADEPLDAQTAGADAAAELDPARGVQVRAVRWCGGDGLPDRLLLCVHHLAVDGVSWRILLDDLAAAWDAVAGDGDSAAGDGDAVLPSQGAGTPFRVWAAHLQELAVSPEVLAELPYWRRTLAPNTNTGTGTDTLTDSHANTDAPSPELDVTPAPWDRAPDPARDTIGTTRTRTLTLPAETAGPLLTSVPVALRTGPAEVLLTALALAARHPGVAGVGGPDSLLLDLEGHGRADRTGRHDLSRTVGWFTTQYPVRLDLRGLDLAAAGQGDGDALAALAGRVHGCLAAVPDHGTGYGLLSRLNPETASELARLPQPRVLFNYLGRFDGADHGPWSPAPGAGALAAHADPAMPVDHCLQIDALAVEGADGPSLTAVLTWPENLLAEEEADALADAWLAALRLLAESSPEAPDSPVRADLAPAGLSRGDMDGLAERHPGLTDVLPLSPLQEGLFFHAAYDATGTDAYTGQIVLTLDGPLDASALRQACGALLARHDALRAAFTDRGLDRPVQVVAGDVEVPWASVDLTTHPTDERDAVWERLLADDRARRFDLERPPLVRFTLVRAGQDRHRLLMTNHHILWDGWSSAVLLRELLTGYADLTGAEPSSLAASAVPYRDHLAWLAGQDREAATAAWRDALAGLDEPTLLGSADPNKLGALPERTTVELSPEATARLTGRARSAGITLNSVVQGCWAILLARLTAREDVVFGGTVSGRTAPVAGIESMVGLLINTLPVRFRVRDEETLLAALTRFQDEQAPLMDHQHLGLADIQRAAGLGTLFDTAVVVENYPLDLAEMRDLAGGVQLAAVDGSDATHYTVNLIVLPGERLRLHLDHRPDVLDTRAALSVAEGLQRLLTAVAEETEATTVGEVDVVSAEQHRMIAEWNDTAAPVPATTLVELFERQTARTPDALATVFGDERLTYAELDARAEALAAGLRARGARPEEIVAVALHRSTELVVALLAVLKSGAAYLPVDPSLPAERIAFMLSDAAPVLLLTTSDVADGLPAAASAPRLLLDAEGGGGTADAAPAVSVAPEPGEPGGLLPSHPAYVIYTSGSTGQPKAVVVEHSAIVNRLLWMQDRYGLGPDDRVLQKTPFGFDVSVWEFFWPLLTGAALVVAEPGGHKDPAYLARVIQRESVTTAHFVPSMLAAFVAEPAAAGCRSLRRVVCSGEALPEELKNRFLDVLDVPLHNLYGPTEAAVDVTHWDCRRADEGPVPIGRPIWNTALYVLDPAGRPVPVGFPGELFLAGAGLARGYLRRPALTAERFPLDPFGPPGSRMYRTGDIARLRADGAVEYLGRTDDQVKIHGFRIELGEIETALARQAGVGRAAVVVREDTPGERRLVGYVVPEPGAAPEAGALRAELARSLPEYMVPLVVVVDALPVTPNGKLDRRALPAPTAAPSGHEPPDGEIEELVAAVWSAVLGVEDVGRHDDFFALGGHSLSATRVAARLRQSLALELPLHMLFEQRTVAALAVAVETALLADIAASTADDALPLMSPISPTAPTAPTSSTSLTSSVAHASQGETS